LSLIFSITEKLPDSDPRNSVPFASIWLEYKNVES
jgi:hypothetical protein